MGTEKGGPVRQELIYIGLGLPAGLMFKDGLTRLHMNPSVTCSGRWGEGREGERVQAADSSQIEFLTALKKSKRPPTFFSFFHCPRRSVLPPFIRSPLPSAEIKELMSAIHFTAGPRNVYW